MVDVSPASSSSTPAATGADGANKAAAAVEEAEGLRRARCLLSELYEIHDFFFTADKAEKKDMLRERCNKVIAQLDKFGEGSTTKERAAVSFIRGRALDVFEAFDREAEAALSKAVKLSPSDIDGWNALGHCFWKKGDLQGAVGCYQEALQKRVNKASLRQLSMVLRQLPAKTMAEAQKNVQESVQRAREAVKLDVRDPESWYVLGNGYTTLFFKVTHALPDLDRALQAYQRAETNGGDSNPDLYFNKANVLRYKEDMAEAAEAFRKAAELDPCLCQEDQLEGLIQRTRRTLDLLDKKGRVKEKRLSALVSGLKAVASPDPDKYKLVTIQDLTVGSNSGKAVALKLVLPVGQLNHPPNSFIVSDATGRCAVLSIYHVDQEACHRLGEKDHVIMVLQPVLKKVRCLLSSPTDMPTPTAAAHKPQGKHESGSQESGESGAVGEGVAAPPAAEEDGDRTYESIQVLDPTSLLVNGKVINAAHVSPAVVRLAAFDV